MWATEGYPEYEGITGLTFESDGRRLVGTFYLARGDEPKPPGSCCVEVDGANQAFAWPRGQLQILIRSWLDEATRDETDQGA